MQKHTSNVEQTNGATIKISTEDAIRRDFILNGNIWKVVFLICGPLALYHFCSQLFRVIDTLMASNISASSVSAVAYLHQITTMIAAIGGGLAIGGSIVISNKYGASDYLTVKKQVNTLIVLSCIVSVIVLALIPFTDPILRLCKTPEDLIAVGRGYFIVSLIETVIVFFNTV